MVEKGTHQELLALNGRYASMWDKHCRAERAAEEARDATRKARKLLCQANLSRGDESPSGYNSMASSTILHHSGISMPASPDSANDSSSQRDNASVSGESTSSANGSEGTLRDDGDDPHHETMPDGYESVASDHTPLLPRNAQPPSFSHATPLNGSAQPLQLISSQFVHGLGANS